MNDSKWDIAYEEGYSARCNGIGYSENPHYYSEEMESVYNAWCAGYNVAVLQLAVVESRRYL